MNLQRNTTATLLEKRLAICMTCGRVGSWKGRTTFEELAVMFEGSTAEIVRLADWDTVKTNKFAIRAIAYLLNCENEKLPKEMMPSSCGLTWCFGMYPVIFHIKSFSIAHLPSKQMLSG